MRKTKRWMAVLAMTFMSTAAVLAKDYRTVVFKVDQINCENCVKTINGNIKFEKGLKDVKTDVKTKTVTIRYDAEKTNAEKLKAGFKKFKYEAVVVTDTKE